MKNAIEMKIEHELTINKEFKDRLQKWEAEIEKYPYDWPTFTKAQSECRKEHDKSFVRHMLYRLMSHGASDKEKAETLLAMRSCLNNYVGDFRPYVYSELEAAKKYFIDTANSARSTDKWFDSSEYNYRAAADIAITLEQPLIRLECLINGKELYAAAELAIKLKQYGALDRIIPNLGWLRTNWLIGDMEYAQNYKAIRYVECQKRCIQRGII